MECKCGTNEPEDCSGCQASLREVCWGDTLDSENSPICLGCSRGMEFMTWVLSCLGKSG